MNKEFIPYEQALQLKNLGFNEPCFAWYNYDGNYILGIDEVSFNSINNYCFNSNLKESVSAPLYQQAFRWFRDKHNLPCWVYTSNNEEFWYSILKDGRMMVIEYKPFNTYEEAELECIKKLIEIVKNKINETDSSRVFK